MFESQRDRIVELARSTATSWVERVRSHLRVPDEPRHHAPVPPRGPDDASRARRASSESADIERLVHQLAAGSSWESRRIAADALAEFRGDRVVDALIRAVRDPSAEVAVAAVGALACQTDPRAAADLAEVIRETEGIVGPFTRAAAVEAIARCRGLAALPLLLETLHDGDAEVSMAAVTAVASLAPAESAPRLFALLEDRSGYYLPVVRLTTVKALERAGVLEPSRARDLLLTETNEGVRVALERVASSAASA